MNKNKNRFAYFKDMPYDLPLPKYEKKFQYLNFEEVNQPKTTPQPPQEPSLQDQINSFKEALSIKENDINNLELNYQKALSTKNHLSYKLGNALIKAHKSWYKGGYSFNWLYPAFWI